MLELDADIYLLNEEEGGMTRDAFSGLMLSFNVNNELIMCRITRGEANSRIERGYQHNVILQLPYGEKYEEFITPGYAFNLNGGEKIIGRGKVNVVRP